MNQRQVQSLVVVEIQPIDHLVHCLAPSSKPSAVELLNLQTTPQTLDGALSQQLLFRLADDFIAQRLSSP